MIFLLAADIKQGLVFIINCLLNVYLLYRAVNLGFFLP